MKVNGTNYYIGRSQSGSYITSNSISSTRLNTYTSGGYSTQYYTTTIMVYDIYVEIEEYDPAGRIKRYFDRYTSRDSVVDHCENAHSMLSDGYHDYRRCSYNERHYSRDGFYSTKNVYYTTIITNGVSNITVSTTKSTSSSSHNFV